MSNRKLFVSSRNLVSNIFFSQFLDLEISGSFSSRQDYKQIREKHLEGYMDTSAKMFLDMLERASTNPFERNNLS